jgi:hypothetical protein
MPVPEATVNFTSRPLNRVAGLQDACLRPNGRMTTRFASSRQIGVLRQTSTLSFDLWAAALHASKETPRR